MSEVRHKYPNEKYDGSVAGLTKWCNDNKEFHYTIEDNEPGDKYPISGRVRDHYRTGFSAEEVAKKLLMAVGATVKPEAETTETKRTKRAASEQADDGVSKRSKGN